MTNEKREVLSFNKVISSLRDYFQEKEYEVFNLFPEALELPIDLYCEGNIIPPEDESEGEPERKERVFVVVCLRPEIKDGEFERLQSYQYYLSKYLSPIEYVMVLVVPDDSKIAGEELYEECGFGLCKVNEKAVITEFKQGISLRKRMILDFERSDIASSHPEIKQYSRRITQIYDLYLHEFARILPVEAEHRHIARTVLDRCLELTRVCYKEDLREVVNRFLSDKSEEEYTFCKKTTEQLWETYIGLPFTEVLSVFEPILSDIVPSGRYRDHSLHQLQVFLTGTYIIDKIYDRFQTKYEAPELSWLIAATTHDVAYPIQYYDQWTAKVFGRLFNITTNIGALELKSHFIEQSFLECIGYLIEHFKKLQLQESLESQWLVEQHSLIQFFYKQATEQRNHGMLQGLSLLKGEGCKGKRGIFVPSALSVSLHHGVWRELKAENILNKITFESDPLTFLLIFLDAVQEWGRPKAGREFTSDEYLEDVFHLRQFEYLPGEKRVKVKLWTPRHLNNEEVFLRKQRDIVEISTFLQHDSQTRFQIELEDKEGHSVAYDMTGPVD